MSKWYNNLNDGYRHIIIVQDTKTGERYILNSEARPDSFIQLVPFDDDTDVNPGIYVDKLGNNTFVLYGGEADARIMHPVYKDVVIDHTSKYFATDDIDGDFSLTDKFDPILLTFQDDNTITKTNSDFYLSYLKRGLPYEYVGVNYHSEYQKLIVVQVQPFLSGSPKRQLEIAKASINSKL